MIGGCTITWKETAKVEMKHMSNKVNCVPGGGEGVLSGDVAEEARRHPGEKVMSSRQM